VEKDLLNRVKTAEKDFQAQIDKAINHSLSEERKEAEDVIRGSLRDSQLKLVEELSELLKMLENDATASADEARAAFSAGLQLIIVIGLAAMVIAALTAFFMTRSITQPLSGAVKVAKSIAAGDLTVSINADEKSRDEIGQLLYAMDVMIKKLHGMIREVTGSTVQLATATEEMSAIMTDTTNNVSRQRSETDEVATAMNEMTATVQEVARNASQAAESAAQADQEAKSSKRIVDKTVQSINSLAQAIEEVAVATGRLNQETHNIGGVLDVIKGIAEQTNLLALNAAIEAARAGEQGRGFAVVADEVRTLASRTQQSTQEIQAMIERLQTGSKDTVRAMEQGLSLVQNTVQESEQAGTSLDKIVRSATSILEMNTQIATAAEEQSHVSEEINRNINNIAQVSEQTVEGARQTADATATLANLAVDLRQLVAQFRV
jgi:methyl-accepting chemotaxis protein